MNNPSSPYLFILLNKQLYIVNSVPGSALSILQTFIHLILINTCVYVLHFTFRYLTILNYHHIVPGYQRQETTKSKKVLSVSKCKWCQNSFGVYHKFFGTVLKLKREVELFFFFLPIENRHNIICVLPDSIIWLIALWVELQALECYIIYLLHHRITSHLSEQNLLERETESIWHFINGQFEWSHH